MALAQSVAGVRQYTQFIALMNNYDVMKTNIQLSKESAGSLQDMQAIYNKSIEGLKSKTQAAKEELFASLTDDDAIKKFYKSLEKVFSFATAISDTFGGLEGILLLTSAALTKLY